MSYIDGFIVPVPEGQGRRISQIGRNVRARRRKPGRNRQRRSRSATAGAWPDHRLLPRGEGDDDENVVFSFIVWPAKDVRDKGWEKIMADPEMQPGAQPMPFDGKRMFWGGFEPIVEHAETTAVTPEAAIS